MAIMIECQHYLIRNKRPISIIKVELPGKLQGRVVSSKFHTNASNNSTLTLTKSPFQMVRNEPIFKVKVVLPINECLGGPWSVLASQSQPWLAMGGHGYSIHLNSSGSPGLQGPPGLQGSGPRTTGFQIWPF